MPVAGTSFFLPSGLVVGSPLEVSGGGIPCYGSTSLVPRASLVYVLFSAMGTSGDLANNTRSRAGLSRAVYAIIFLGFMSSCVWGTTVMTAWPHDDLVFPDYDDDHFDPVGHHPERAVPLALWRSIRYNTPSGLRGFSPMFGIALDRLPLGLAPSASPCTIRITSSGTSIRGRVTIFALLAGMYSGFQNDRRQMMRSRKIPHGVRVLMAFSSRCSSRGCTA